MAKSRGNAFTKNEWEVIKTLAKAGLSNRQMMNITNRSEFTVQQAKKAETWEQYEANRADRTAKLRAKDPRIKANREAVQTSVQQDVQPTERPSNDFKFHTSMLVLADAVNRLADILETDTPIQKEAKEYKLFGRR